MSSTPTTEQIEQSRRGRQRLIGAVVLVLVAVVFVPMVLDPEPRQERIEPTLVIPPRDGAPSPGVTMAPGTAPPLPGPAGAPVADPAPKSGAPVAVPEPRKLVASRAPEFMSAAPRTEPTKPKAGPAPAADPKLVGFAVQVGAFREESKLAQARERIAEARLTHYTERLEGGASGELTRLRAGPFPSREAAEKAAALLKLSGLDAQVVALP